MDRPSAAVHAFPQLGRSELAADEIDLVDLAVILVRHWRLMLVVLVLATALGAAAATLKGSSYQYTAVISIGQRASGEPLDSPEAVQAAISNIYLPAAAAEADEQGQKLASKMRVEVPKGGRTVFLKLSAPEHGAADVEQLFGRIGERLIADQSGRYERLVEPLKVQIAERETALTNLAGELVRLQGELADAKPDARVLLLDQIGRLQEARRLMQQDLIQLQAEMSRIEGVTNSVC